MTKIKKKNVCKRWIKNFDVFFQPTFRHFVWLGILTSRVVFEAEGSGGSKAGGLPHPSLSPFPPLPFPFPYILSLPMGGKVRSSEGEVPRLPPYKYHPVDITGVFRILQRGVHGTNGPVVNTPVIDIMPRKSVLWWWWWWWWWYPCMYRSISGWEACSYYLSLN